MSTCSKGAPVTHHKSVSKLFTVLALLLTMSCGSSLPINPQPTPTLFVFPTLPSGSIPTAELTATLEPTATIAEPTPPPTFTPTSTPTLTLTPTPVSAIASEVRQLAEAGVSRNADWTPYTQEINGVKMALVPAGCFQMGSTDEQLDSVIELCEQDQNRPSPCRRSDYEDEQPAYKVCFEKPFWIDVHEVTNAQFEAFEGQSQFSSEGIQDASPRESINWDEANAFCQKRGVRLLTEAEWEYAARGPDGLMYPWGNEFISDNVVYRGRSGGQTRVVFWSPGDVSWIGAYNLGGNVSELVTDKYGAYPSGQPIAPTGFEEVGMYVVRGGSWGSPKSDTHAAKRGWQPGDTWSNSVGFRCGGDFSILP